MSIQNYLNQIKNAVFGKDVRQSIHDAIKQCYDDASINHDNANMEVKLARGSHTTLNDRLNESEKNQDNLSSQLVYIETNKANKNEVRKKEEPVTMVDLSQDVKEKITGGAVAVVGRQGTRDINIVDHSISIDKLPLKYLVKTDNLLKMINYDNIEEGIISLNNNLLKLQWSGSKNAIIETTPFTLKGGIQYYIHFDDTFSMNQMQFELRSDKIGTNKIVAYINSGQVVFANTPPSDFQVNYLKIVGTDINFNGHIWIDKSLKNEYYPPYNSKIVLTDDLKNIEEKLYDINLDNLNYNLTSIIYDEGKYNLYNKKASENGKSIDCLGNITIDEGRILTDFIDVEEFFKTKEHIWFKQSLDGETVSNGNIAYMAVYDSNKTNICTSVNQFYDTGLVGKSSLPEGYKFIRVCFPKNYSNFGIGDSNACLFNYYTPKKIVEDEVIEHINSLINGIQAEIDVLKNSSNVVRVDKKCLFYGDSITAQDLFQKIVKEILGIEYINNGNPGYPLSNVFANNNDHGFSLSSTYKLNELINQINTSKIQYPFIMGGTNDFGYDGTKQETEEGSFNAINIGDLSYPYNRNTYIGALSNIVDRIQRECPTVEKIFIMSPIQRGEDDATDIVKNALGLSMLDFRNACEEVANKFSCEFIDVYSCGINFINWSKYIPDKIHPNDSGALLIAYVIIAYLKNMIHI